jgi:diguanylate cyclase (GGDEF)-like protein
MLKLKRITFVSHLTSLIGLVLLFFLFLCSLWATTLIQQSLSAVSLSTSVSSTYQQLLFVLAEEETLQYEYELHPSTALRNEHFTKATMLSTLLQGLPQDTSTGDNRLDQHLLLTQQTAYTFYTGQVFSEIDSRNFTQASTIRTQNVIPVFSLIENELTVQTKREAAASAHNLAQLTQIQHTIAVGAPIVFFIGLLLSGITYYVQRSYRGKLDTATQTEIVRLEHLISTDSLTGLGNHYAYQEHLSRALEQAQHNHEPLILAVLNIDEFKTINDEQGHQRGDEILCTVTTLLREANLSGALFRLGADDFGVIMPQTAQAEATWALERLCKEVHHRLFDVTISIGMTCTDFTNFDGLTLEEFQAQAVLTLQEAKRQGRNRVVTFEAIKNAAAFVPLEKRQAVRRLLRERRLTVAFQPIWDLATDTVLAYEALTRPAAEYGFTGPQEVFDIAEQMGRAHELDAICVEKILARAADLPPNVLLFMNLTPQSLVHDLLTGALLLQGVISAGLEPSRVVLEITERSTVQLAEVIQQAKFLQQMGFRLALDDAGAGNAGLEMLSQLPVDFVKIDRSVVVKALTDPAMHSVFLGITTIARESHLFVVAEGIENTEMLDFVRQADVQYAQGYLLGRPNEAIPVSNNMNALTSLGKHSAAEV